MIFGDVPDAALQGIYQLVQWGLMMVCMIVAYIDMLYMDGMDLTHARNSEWSGVSDFIM